MSIAGHVSRALLSRYSHLPAEAKRRALDEIAAFVCGFGIPITSGALGHRRVRFGGLNE
ncbi:MAG: hypothetical protein ABSH56_27350 [Bryobacteraceae bacterium]|jgi:hypothetical protein